MSFKIFNVDGISLTKREGQDQSLYVILSHLVQKLVHQMELNISSAQLIFYVWEYLGVYPPLKDKKNYWFGLPGEMHFSAGKVC